MPRALCFCMQTSVAMVTTHICTKIVLRNTCTVFKQLKWNLVYTMTFRCRCARQVYVFFRQNVAMVTNILTKTCAAKYFHNIGEIKVKFCVCDDLFLYSCKMSFVFVPDLPLPWKRHIFFKILCHDLLQSIKQLKQNLEYGVTMSCKYAIHVYISWMKTLPW